MSSSFTFACLVVRLTIGDEFHSVNTVTRFATPQPFLQQVYLGALARTVDALNNNQGSGILLVVGMLPITVAHPVRVIGLNCGHTSPPAPYFHFLIRSEAN